METTMFDSKFFEDLNARIAEVIAASPAKDIEKNMKAILLARHQIEPGEHRHEHRLHVLLDVLRRAGGDDFRDLGVDVIEEFLVEHGGSFAVAGSDQSSKTRLGRVCAMARCEIPPDRVGPLWPQSALWSPCIAKSDRNPAQYSRSEGWGAARSIRLTLQRGSPAVAAIHGGGP